MAGWVGVEAYDDELLWNSALTERSVGTVVRAKETTETTSQPTNDGAVNGAVSGTVIINNNKQQQTNKNCCCSPCGRSSTP